jgi:hypothetical protein
MSCYKLKKTHLAAYRTAKRRVKRRETDLSKLLKACQEPSVAGSTLIIKTNSQFAVEGLRKYWLPVLLFAQEKNCDRAFIFLNDSKRPYYEIYDWYITLSIA